MRVLFGLSQAWDCLVGRELPKLQQQAIGARSSQSDKIAGRPEAEQPSKARLGNGCGKCRNAREGNGGEEHTVAGHQVLLTWGLVLLVVVVVVQKMVACGSKWHRICWWASANSQVQV